MTLPEPTTDDGARGLRALLDDPAGAVLALDFDGVLAPIVADPTRSRAHEGVVPVLSRLAPLLGSIVVITGRPAAVAVEYAGVAGIAALRGLVVYGLYGVERWDGRSGEVDAPPLEAGVAAARAELPSLLDDLGMADVHLEDKGRSLALHTRRTPDPERSMARLAEPLAGLAARHGLAVEPGRMVIELRPPGTDKGRALRRHVAECGGRTVVYAGDDLGDLPAFAAIDELRLAGTPGLKVCSGSAEVRALADRADLVVDGPVGVVAFLDALADELEARHRR